MIYYDKEEIVFEMRGAFARSRINKFHRINASQEKFSLHKYELQFHVRFGNYEFMLSTAT